MNETQADQVKSDEHELIVEIEELEPLTVPCALPSGCMGGVLFPYPFENLLK